MIRAVSRSWREIVSFSLQSRFDMSAAERLRAAVSGGDVSSIPYDPIFIHVVSRIIRDFPGFMSRIDGGKVRTGDSVNIGFMAAFRKGLFNLTVCDADRLGIEETNREVRDLLFRVARGKMRESDLRRACLSISNLSKYPVHTFNAVIPPGQSGVLAVAAVEETLVPKDGQTVVLPMCCVTLTVDHRLINGSEAAQFLARLKQEMEGLQI